MAKAMAATTSVRITSSRPLLRRLGTSGGRSAERRALLADSPGRDCVASGFAEEDWAEEDWVDEDGADEAWADVDCADEGCADEDWAGPFCAGPACDGPDCGLPPGG